MALGAAALAASTFLVPTAKADIGVPLPVLWEGRVEEGGQPASAEVVAFLRPPADALLPGVPLVPLATTRTDSDGRFTLRSLPTAAVAAVTPESGWVTLMVAAFTDEGISIAMDSVAWRDGWVTDPSALLADTPLGAQGRHRPTQRAGDRAHEVRHAVRGGQGPGARSLRCRFVLADRPGGSRAEGRFEWGCNKGYPDVHHAETLEPTLWTGDLRRSPDGAPATCNQKYAINVEPKAEPYRKGGQSQTLRGAINVLGFSGSVTSGFSKEVRNEWHNPMDANRTLCGESDFITLRTRVTSLA